MSRSSVEKIKKLRNKNIGRHEAVRLFKKYVPDIESYIFDVKVVPEGLVIGSIGKTAYTICDTFKKTFYMNSDIAKHKTKELMISNFRLPKGHPVDSIRNKQSKK